MSRLLDPRLQPALREFFESVCTVMQQTVTESASGEPEVSGDPTVVAGLDNIHCRIGPMILIRPTDNELLTQETQAAVQIRQVKLDGYFPGITVRGMFAVVDGVSYPIRGVEHDGSRFSTRLRCEVVTP